MVDCRSLIEFCREFDQHKHRSRKPKPSSFCAHSRFAAVDALILVLVLAAIAVLAVPCFRFLLAQLLPLVFDAFCDTVLRSPFTVAFVSGFILVLSLAFIGKEISACQKRKCGNPFCKGLRKAVEFDIQLESEELVKYLPPVPKDMLGLRELDLGEKQKELEAELKKLAPVNGRTVLIFRAPCGCPERVMEVWGNKKVRRSRK